MGVTQLIGADALLTLVGGALWITAAVRSTGGRRVTTLIAGALTVTAARIAVHVILATHGWWFAAEKLTVGATLAVMSIGIAVACRFAPLTLFICGYATIASLIATFAIGYPVRPPAVIAIVALVVGAAAITAPRSRLTATLAVVGLLIPVGVIASSLLTGRSGHHHSGDLQVASLVGPEGSADKTYRLTAAKAADGRWLFNGQLPGPEIRVVEGDLVEVTLANTDIAEGVTVHWHGYPVANAEDGVAGVTQNPVLPGQSYVYRFRASVTGTYWYHTHQISSTGIAKGLFGAFIVTPRAPAVSSSPKAGRPSAQTGAPPVSVGAPSAQAGARPAPMGAEQVLILHPLLPAPATVAPGRLRLVNADNVPHTVTPSGSYRVLALDGRDLHGPTGVTGAVLVPAGGRVDLDVAGGTLAVDDGSARLDLMSYGMPEPADPNPVAFDSAATVVLDRLIRFQSGRPDFAYTVNGTTFPSADAITVRPGELLKLTIVNRNGEDHPMHLHGHAMRVLSRDGVMASGSPIWLDTLNVGPGEVWTVAIRATNPGIWMVHCHNLPHAAHGMMLHLVYPGYTGVFTGKPE